MEAAVSRLVAAHRAAGLGRVERAPRKVGRVLDEIARTIAPLRLPEEVDRFWRLLDPGSLQAWPYPRPVSPEFALQCWTDMRDNSPGMAPRLLFPVCCESHGFLFVELEDGRGSGGTCLEWAFAGSPFYVRFPSLTAYVDLFATMLELGEVARVERSWGTQVVFDPEERWGDAQAVRLAAAQPLPGFGTVRELDEDVAAWPEHWLASNGLGPETRTPRGATTTVAALLREAAAGAPVTGTIRGRVTSLFGSGAGSRVTVHDGTGELDVWCPAAVCTYGPVIRDEFEFDVVVRNATPPPVVDTGEVQAHALAGDIEAAQAAAMNLFANAFDPPAAAEATAIRRLR